MKRSWFSILLDFLLFRRYRRRIMRRAFTWRPDSPLPDTAKSDLNQLTVADFIRPGGVILEHHAPVALPESIPAGVWSAEVRQSYQLTHNYRAAVDMAYAHLLRQTSGSMAPVQPISRPTVILTREEDSDTETMPAVVRARRLRWSKP